VLGGTGTLGDCLAALRVLCSDRLVEGDAIEEFERAFAARVGRRHGFSFASARVGLYGLLRALGIGEGDEVLLPVPTHIVVANAVRYTGARPVYVDCRSLGCEMDLDDAAAKATARTKALILQHTFGIPNDVERALDLARRCNGVLIEDCVHALGAEYGGRPLGSAGVAGVFSTEETKTISTTMGGMVVTDREDLAAAMRVYQARCEPPPASLAARYLLKFIVYHALTEPHVHRSFRELYNRMGRRSPLPEATAPEEMRGEKPEGYEQRLSNGQAVLGLRQLRRLDANIEHRRRITELYARAFARLGVAPLAVLPRADPALLRYPIWVEDRERVITEAGPDVPLGTWFTSVLEEAIAPGSGGYETGTCPRAEAAAAHLVNLPTHPRITEGDVDHFVSRLVRAGALDGPSSRRALGG
jgi:dTDP-4-amino-4,6-dideoxygalactose transaminase